MHQGAVSYFDTTDLRLLQAGIVVRRTSGGWRLDAGEHKQRWRDPEGMPPDELLRLLEPWAPEGVEPVLRLSIVRTEHEILDADAILRLALGDDQVRATPFGITLTTSRWRTLRLERGLAGTEQDLQQAADELVRDGAVLRPGGSSALATAVHGHPRRQPAATAGQALGEYLRAQCDALAGGHFAVSQNPFDDEPAAEPPEAVHKTRVATRRLRATLRSFGELFDACDAARLEAELVWFAGVLGPVRDLEVLRSRLAHAVAELAPELVVGPVGQQIDSFLKVELHQAATALLDALAGQRYRELVGELARWRTAPPFTELAALPATSLRRQVDAAEQALAKRLSRASRDPQDERLHSARKAGKRARYAAEATAPVLGKRASTLVASAERLQTVLGEHQDAVVTIEVLRRIADQLAAEGQNTFSYGVLVAEQQRRATESAAAARG